MGQRFVRDSITWLCYLLLGYFAYLMDILGPVTPYLRDELHASYTLASLHFSAFAVGMLGAGLVAERVLRRLGPLATIWWGSAGMGTAALGLALGRQPWVTIGAALAMGFLGSLTLTTIPGLLSARYGEQRAIALTELNVAGSLAGMTAPFAVGMLARTSWGWRAAVLAAPVLLLGLWLGLRGKTQGGAALPARSISVRRSLPGAFWLAWVLIFLVVSVEFCMVYWGANFMEQVVGLKRADAALTGTLYLGAMLVGRWLGSRMLRWAAPRWMFLGSLTAAAAGFGLFIGGTAVPALLGFFLTGLGVANLYPLALSSALAAAGEAADQGSARATLASGTAILGLPLLLGALADALDLRTAFWLVPLLLCTALGLFTFIQRQNHPQPSLEGVKLGAGSSK